MVSVHKYKTLGGIGIYTQTFTLGPAQYKNHTGQKRTGSPERMTRLTERGRRSTTRGQAEPRAPLAEVASYIHSYPCLHLTPTRTTVTRQSSQTHRGRRKHVLLLWVGHLVSGRRLRRRKQHSCWRRHARVHTDAETLGTAWVIQRATVWLVRVNFRLEMKRTLLRLGGGQANFFSTSGLKK